MTPSRFRCLVSGGLMFGSLTMVMVRAGAATPTPPDPQPGLQSQSGRGGSDAPARSITFEIYKDRSGEHRWRLLATNGQTIGTSGQGYKDKRDCKNAIERIKKDVATKLKFETYEDNARRFRWRLLATNGQTIGTSGQGYKDKRDCEHAIEVIKKGAETAKVEEAA